MAVVFGGGTFGTRTVAPYQSCYGEVYYNSPTWEQEWRVRHIYRSTNDMPMTCDGSGGNASADYVAWGHRQGELMHWNAGWIDGIAATLNNPVCTGPNIPAGCRAAAYPWPYSQLAGVILHEISHTHGYSHGANNDNTAAQTVCQRSGGWHFQVNSMPYIIEACTDIVLQESTRVCGAINSGCSGGFRLVSNSSANSCQCVKDPGWDEIGGAAGAIAASDYGVFAVYPGNGQLMRYNISTNTWAAIGGPWTQFVTNDVALYGLTSAGVFQYSGSGSAWTQIGGPASQLIAGGNRLYAVDTGNTAIFQYQNSPYAWAAIGGGGAQFVAHDTKLFARTPGGAAVVEYTGTPHSWTWIGGGSSQLIAGGTTLYSLDPGTGNVQRYNGSPYSWTVVGGPGLQFVANRNGLFTRNPDGIVTYKLMHNGTYWAPAAMNLQELAGGGNALIGRHSTGNLMRAANSDAVGTGY